MSSNQKKNTIMKKANVLILNVLLCSCSIFAQVDLPTFLVGTWTDQSETTFERWDIVNGKTLKGLSYKMLDNGIEVTEYMEIVYADGHLLYKATVLDQNDGQEVVFKSTPIDSSLIFENNNHDFPQQIQYKQISDHEVSIRLSGQSQKDIRYTLLKLTKASADAVHNQENPLYNPKLAAKLGADDYGMKGYVFALLKTGPTVIEDKDKLSNIFRGHMENINRLAQEEHLILAGPIGANDQNYRGIFILNVNTIEEAEALVLTDPAVSEGVLDVDLYQWYGSAALIKYLDYAEKIWKIKP